jgi:hypothetical protein
MALLAAGSVRAIEYEVKDYDVAWVSHGWSLDSTLRNCPSGTLKLQV